MSGNEQTQPPTGLNVRTGLSQRKKVEKKDKQRRTQSRVASTTGIRATQSQGYDYTDGHQ
jgi:hypothetical protein